MIVNAIYAKEDVLYIIIYVLIIVTVTALQITGIAFAWPYAFPGDADAENAAKQGKDKKSF